MPRPSVLSAKTSRLEGNVFLNSLPKKIREKIQSGGETVRLKVRQPVYEPGGAVEHVYFPMEGGISNVFVMSNGAQVEVGMIGREGVSGFPAVFTGGTSTSSLYTQIAGTALKVPGYVIALVVQESKSSLEQFLRYVDMQLGQLSQYSACNRLHSIDERLARWLVMAHDRTAGDVIPITHEFLALMLGVQRAGVTNAALTMQEFGAITYKRGTVVVRDRAALQSKACECYDAVEDRFEEQMGYTIRKHRTRSPSA